MLLATVSAHYVSTFSLRQQRNFLLVGRSNAETVSAFEERGESDLMFEVTDGTGDALIGTQGAKAHHQNKTGCM